MSEQIRTGLWKKESERGSYYTGSVEINGQHYWVNLYKNDRKESDKHPDLNLALKPKDAPQRSASAPAPAPHDSFDDDEINF